MLSLYLIELIIFILFITFVFLRNKIASKKAEIKQESGTASRKGSVVINTTHLEKNEKIYIIICVVFLIGLICQYLFEIPQMEFDKTSIEAKSSEDLTVPNTTYHFHNVTNEVTIEKGDFNKNITGVYKVRYKTKTLFGSYTKEVDISVVDTLAPEISLEGGENYNQSYAKVYTEPGVKAIDLNEGDLSDKIITTRENISDTEFNIKYEVQDSNNNKAQKIRHIVIVDDIPPVLNLNGQENMKVLIGQAYDEQGATAVDEKDGDVTNNIKTEGSVDTSKEGTYTITYTATDTKGNETKKTRTISVIKKVTANNGSTGQNSVIYLTFDDGPSTNITPKILDILSKKNVKATFFILNYDTAREAIVKREVNEGHTVAIHGYSHDYKTIYKSENAFMDNISKLREKIKNSTGYDSTIIRFPGGSSNTVSKFNPGIMTRLTAKVINSGYTYFDWNVDSNDAGSAKTSTQVYNNVTKNLSKNRANVVLMHDFSGNTKTLNALEDIINYSLNNGYSFEKITPNTPMVTHRVNN